MPPVAYRMTVTFLGHTIEETHHADTLRPLYAAAERYGCTDLDFTRTTYGPNNDGSTHWTLTRSVFTGTKQGEPIEAHFAAIT